MLPLLCDGLLDWCMSRGTMSLSDCYPVGLRPLGWFMKGKEDLFAIYSRDVREEVARKPPGNESRVLSMG